MTQHQRSEGEDIEVDFDDAPTVGDASSSRAHSVVARRRGSASGIAPRGTGDTAPEESPRARSLYERLVESGALDEVMEVAAREQAERATGSLDAVMEASDDLSPAPGTDMTAEGAGPLLPDAQTPMPLPRNAPTPDEPSVMLGPGASSRGDSTERVVLPGASNSVSESLIRPAARPARREPSSVTVLLWVALAFAGAGFVAWWALNHARAPRPDSSSPATVQVARSPRPAPPRSETEESSVSPPAPVERAEEEALESARAAAPSEPEEAKKTSKPPRRQKTRARRDRGERRAALAAASTEPEAPGAEPAEPTDAPEPRVTPSREEVIAVMSGLVPALRECAQGEHGIARLTLTVLGQGRVTHAVVYGDFAGTPQGSCMARAVKDARFPEFSQHHLKLTYPVKL